MPRTCTVCTHPGRAEIDKALVAGELSFRNIAERFSVSAAALHRHKADHLPQRLEAAKAATDAAQDLDMMDELRRCFERVNLLFDACDRWLRDADDPAQYDIGPRAEELRVTYEEEHGERTVTMVETKHADPRELVLKTAARLQPQIELLAKLIGQLDERPQVNILVSLEWLELRAMIVGALSPHPGAQEAVLEAIEGVSNGSYFLKTISGSPWTVWRSPIG